MKCARHASRLRNRVTQLTGETVQGVTNTAHNNHPHYSRFTSVQVNTIMPKMHTSVINSWPCDTLTHPEIIHHLADSLVLGGDFLREVLMETRFDWEAFGKWRPVIFFTCQDRRERERFTVKHCRRGGGSVLPNMSFSKRGNL